MEDGKGKTKPTPASLPLLERCGATTSAIPSTLAVAASPRLAPKPLSSTAQLFTPKWPANSLGVSIREREAAVFVHKRVAGAQELQFPDLFRYGIRFRPEVNETDIYRTVLVDNLPPKMTLFPLLQRVKGGLVLDAKMLNTIRVTGSMSAIITFVHDFGARAFIDGVSRQPLVFGTHHRARVTLLPTPTYPISKSLRAAIVTHGHTRCLEIRNFPRGITPAALERDLRVCDTMSTHRIEAKRMRDDGVLEMRFTSVGYAGRAYGILTSRVRYRGCGVVFSRDPCARAWEAVTTLLPHNPPASTEIDSKPEIRTTDYAEEAKDEDCTGRLNDVVFDDEPSEVQRGRGFGYDEALATANNNTCSPQ